MIYFFDNTETVVERVGNMLVAEVTTDNVRRVEFVGGQVSVRGFTSLDDLLETLQLVTQVDANEKIKHYEKGE